MSSKNRTPALPQPEPTPAALPPLTVGRAALEILRPVNCTITFCSVLLGGWLGSHDLPLPLLLAGLSAALLTGGGNALNDLCGIQEDRINKPGRPLPANRLPLWLARQETLLALVAGLAISLYLPAPAPLIALFATAGLILYNLRFKKIPLLGNLTVSLLGGLAFLYGGAAVNALFPALLPALFAFLYHLGRELLKDLEDRAGDRVLNGNTVPLRWGHGKTCVLITGVYAVLITGMPLPWLVGALGLPYLTCVSALTLLLTYVVVTLWRTREPQSLRRLSHLLKAGMVLGLCAFLFDTL